MKVVLVNWAQVWDGAAMGGGVNGYVQSLATELSRRSHEVISLCGGTSYRSDSERGNSTSSKCHIVRHPDWQGIRVFEVINSPVLAPSIAQFREPLTELEAPILEHQIHRLIEWLKPDIVHFHSLEGFSTGCVDAARRSSSTPRLLFSLHNYHTICPQVHLMQEDRHPCFSFAEGAACSECIPAVEPDEWRRYREATPTGSERALVVTAPVDVSDPLPPVGADFRGHPSYRRDPRRQVRSGYDATPITDLLPLLNTVEPDPLSPTPTHPYGRRRAAMIAMLNRCDRVLAVSDFVARKFESLGVLPAVISTVHIGTRIADIATASTPRSIRVAGSPHGPVRMAFLGYNSWNKGLPMLARALERLPPDVLSNIDLSIFATGGGSLEEQFKLVRPHLARLHLRDGYSFEEVPDLVHDIDLGLVPSVWWDNAPQTVMEFLACGIPVLGAALGGIPDFVRDGENGLLFRGNDPADLARILCDVVGDPGRICILQRNVTRPKGMVEHTDELEALYHG